MSKEELIEEISDIRKELYKLQDEEINTGPETALYITQYLNEALNSLGELKEYLRDL